MVNLNGNNVIADGGTGNGGGITINGSTGVTNGGNISTNSNSGNGGAINVNGGTGNVDVGNISSMSTDGNGGNTSVTAGGTITTGIIDTSSTNGAGGGITTNSGGDTTTGNLIASGGAGNGGAINSTSGGNLTTGSIDASSNTGDGGSFTGTAGSGNIMTGVIDVSSTGGLGGQVTTNSENIMVGGGINANGGTTGGTILITTTDTMNTLVSGGGGPNSINGNITANGVDGGRINLSANGGHQVDGTVQANGTTGDGGVVVLQTAAPGTNDLNVVINGLVQATNNACSSGNVALNTGPGANLLATGTGTIDVGGNIVFGNADPVTGDPVAPPGGLLIVAGITLQACGSIIFNGIVPQPPQDVIPVIGPSNAPIIVNQPQQQFIPFLNNRDQTRIIEGSVEKNAFEPGPKATKIIQASKSYRNNFDQSELARLSKEGNLVKQMEERFISIDNGNIVFAPDKTIVVKVKEGKVIIPGGSVVFISENGADSAIYDLHQTGANGVKVVSEGKMMSLHPGKMIFLSKAKTSNFGHIDHQCKIIGHRNPQHKQLSDDVRAFAVNFSIPSAIKKVQPFRKMMKSSDKKDKVVIKKLLMNAVLLKEAMPYQGPYMSTGHINP